MTWIAARHHSIGHQQEIIDTRCGNASRRLEQGAGVGPRGGRDRLTVGEGMIKCHILAWCRVLIVEAHGLQVERERSEEHTSELQSLMRISYAVFCLKKKNKPRASNTLITRPV